MQYFKLWSSRGTSKGFFVPRYAGSEPRNGVATVFNQFAWGGPEYKRKPGSPQAANSAAYSEGGAWQYRFYVPHDPDGLADLYQKAGLDLCDMILESQTMEAKVDAKNSAYNGGYGEPIHEMEEMKFRCWGQYECNNQNSFHVLWMLAAVHNGKCASKAQPLLHKVLTEAFVPGLRMFPGDEDNGSMSAFYLLSALGIYHLAPGSGKWLVTGAPLFNNVRLQVANGNVLSISKVNAKAGNCVARRLWNGQAVTTAALDFKQLATGGRLQFFMQKCTEVELKATREINKQKLAQRKQDHQNKMSKSAPNELLLKEERQLRQKVKTRLRNAVKLPPRVGTKRTKRLNTMREARVRIRSRST